MPTPAEIDARLYPTAKQRVARPFITADLAPDDSGTAAKQSAYPVDLSAALVNYTALLSLKIPERPRYQIGRAHV